MTNIKDYTACDNNNVCNVSTGNCVADIARNKSGKTTLEVDGRVIVGDVDTITKLQAAIGGVMKAVKAVRGNKSKKPVNAPASARAKKSIEDRIAQFTHVGEDDEVQRLKNKLASLKKKTPPKKKTPAPIKVPSATPPKKKTPTPIKARSATPLQGGIDVTASREDIRRTFIECLSKLGAK